MPFIRVVLAFDTEDEARVRAVLEHMIENDNTTPDAPRTGITGAHVSGTYRSRTLATSGPWVEEGLTRSETLEDDITAECMSYEEELRAYWQEA